MFPAVSYAHPAVCASVGSIRFVAGSNAVTLHPVVLVLFGVMDRSEALMIAVWRDEYRSASFRAIRDVK